MAADPPSDPPPAASGDASAFGEPAATAPRVVRSIHDVKDIHVERHGRDGIMREIKAHLVIDLDEGRYTGRNPLTDYQAIAKRLKPGQPWFDLLGTVYAVAPRQKQSRVAVEQPEPPVEPTATPNVVKLQVVETRDPHRAAEPVPPAEWPPQRSADRPEWGYAVDGDYLVTTLIARFERHLSLPPGAAVVTAFWVVATHLIDACRFAPRLLIPSPEGECGKSTLIEMLEILCARGAPFAGISEADLFHLIDEDAPTLCVDEGQGVITNKSLLRILDAGISRKVFVRRRIGGQSVKFSVFAAMAIAVLLDPNKPNPMSAATMSRFIIIAMQRALPHELKRLRDTGRVLAADERAMEDEGRQSARWARDNAHALKDADPEMPDALLGREGDKYRMLIAIADLIGGAWPALLREAIEHVRGTNEAPVVSERIQVLDALRGFVVKHPTWAMFKSANLLKWLVADADHDCDWRFLNTKRLFLLLRPIRPKAHRIADGPDKGKTLQGYPREILEDAFARYLPPASTTPDVADVAGVAAPEGLTEAEAAIGALYMAEAAKRRKLNFWLVPPELMAELVAEFGAKFFDACPYPRPEWDGLTLDWIEAARQAAATWIWINAPFTGRAFTAFCMKAISESRRGALCVVVGPCYQSAALDALHKAGAEIRHIGSPAFVAIEDGRTPNPNPRQPCFIAVLKPPVAAGIDPSTEMPPSTRLAQIASSVRAKGFAVIVEEE